MLGRIFHASRLRDAAHALYTSIVEQARQPAFYRDFSVPDTVDGRFDMITLHAVLVLRRLKQDHGKTAALAQALFDLMFADMDQNLREIGFGDLAVAKRVKAMASAFYGRLAAYDAGLGEAAEGELEKALERNLFRHSHPGDAAISAVARYVRREAAALDGVATGQLMRGEVAFGRAPGSGEGEQ